MIFKDDLGYESIFDSWMSQHEYPVLAVRAETMKRHEKAIQEFLGIKVRVPEWKPRAGIEYPENDLISIRKTHARLKSKIENTPDIFMVSDRDDGQSRVLSRS